MGKSVISKELFIEFIEALRSQYNRDKEVSDVLNGFFGSSDIMLYDNSVLVKAIFSLLRDSFPVDSEGHCELEFYCYAQNFGKVGDVYESPSELYDRLVKLKYISGFDEIDKDFVSQSFVKLIPISPDKNLTEQIIRS